MQLTLHKAQQHRAPGTAHAPAWFSALSQAGRSQWHLAHPQLGSDLLETGQLALAQPTAPSRVFLIAPPCPKALQDRQARRPLGAPAHSTRSRYCHCRLAALTVESQTLPDARRQGGVSLTLELKCR